MSFTELQIAKEYIYSANLQPVLDRLIYVDGWQKKDTLAACAQYRNYLFLKRKYPNLELPPSKDIDAVWHAHILHSKNYLEFCMQVFGYFLHHVPGDPNNQAEKTLLTHSFEKNTQEMHFKEFGDYIYEVRLPSLSEFLKDFTSFLFAKFKQLILVKFSINT